MGLRCDRRVHKEGPKQVSDGLGERGEEEKVFTRWPEVGWTMGRVSNMETRCRTTNLTVVGQPGDVWGSEVR